MLAHKFFIQVYLEPTDSNDPTCGGACGIDLTFMYYEGISECVQRANDVDKWWIGDYSKGKYIQDPTVKVKCDNQGNFEKNHIQIPLCVYY